MFRLTLSSVLAAALCGGVCLPAAAQGPDPQTTTAAWESFGDEVEAALNRGPAAARRHFAPPFWRDREGPRSMLRELAREQMTLSITTVGVSADGGRAVLQFDVMQGERRADTVFMYAMQSGSRRRIHFIDESRCHQRGFLAGDLPAAPPRGQDGPLCQE